MLFGSMEIKNNELNIGGLSANSLVKEFGSPLYVFDEALLNQTIDKYQKTFNSDAFNTRVAYASKAFLTLEMARLLKKHDMSIDCVSIGELYTVYKAGFDMSKVIFHGNNKSREELIFALEHQVGLIVVDNIEELKVIIELNKTYQTSVHTLLRVNPGVVAHTHEYIVTAKHTSKFGESIYDKERLNDIINIYHKQSLVVLDGFHCHIGSQVFEITSYEKTIEAMTNFIVEIENKYGVYINTLNIGGGFGVYYHEGDQPVSIEDITKTIIHTVEKCVKDRSLHINELIIEPGRSIVANAGTTLYSIGYTKKTYGLKEYIFVDGGMSDNIRPALYQAEYSADIATNMNAEKNTQYTVAGKLCETGDVLIRDVMLPEVRKDDILAIYSTGAYTYSMSSNYNRILKPAVVFVNQGKAKVVVKRETLEDLIRNDL